jgi:NAD(P)-dependent dehydrogenase (short-subunit alcohol dehydrogenase family)
MWCSELVSEKKASQNAWLRDIDVPGNVIRYARSPRRKPHLHRIGHTLGQRSRSKAQRSGVAHFCRCATLSNFGRRGSSHERPRVRPGAAFTASKRAAVGPATNCAVTYGPLGLRFNTAAPAPATNIVAAWGSQLAAECLGPLMRPTVPTPPPRRSPPPSPSCSAATAPTSTAPSSPARRLVGTVRERHHKAHPMS